MTLENRLSKLDDFKKTLVAKELEKKNCLESLFYLCHWLGYKDVNIDTHGPIIHALEMPTRRKLFVYPRGSYKSTIISICYPIWLLLRDPDLRIFIDSEIYSNSIRYLGLIKAHIESEKFINTWGNLVGDMWRDDSITLANRRKSYKEPSIMVGGVGTRKIGMHYDCIHPNTKILTSNGYVKAKDIKFKMKVLTSSGQFKRVVSIATRFTNKKLYGVRAKYQCETNWVTEDHKILVLREHVKQWIEAKDLRMSDYLLIPIPSGETRQISRSNEIENKLILKKDIWRLIGYWLAEGCRSKQTNMIRLSFSKNETEYINDVKNIVETHLKVKCNIPKPTKSNTVVVNFSHKGMKLILSRFGDLAHNKYLPPFALNAPRSRQIELIRGYWRGDGSRSSDNNVISFSSVSKDLLSGFQLLLTRFQMNSSISLSKRNDFGLVVGKRCFIRNYYTLWTTSPLLHKLLGFEVSLNHLSFAKKSFFTDKYWAVPLHKVENKDYCGEVYDFQINDCHDFYLPGMIAHNCIIADDYNSPQNTSTPEAAQKVVDHFKYNLNILEPTGTYVIVGTRYSEQDILGWILREVLHQKDLSIGILKENGKS